MKQFTIFSKDLGVRVYKFLTYERMRYVGDWKSLIHNHSYMEILFITDGKGFLRTLDGDMPIHKGMIVIINPTVMHTELSDEIDHLEYAVFSLDDIIFTQKKSDEYNEVFLFDFSADFETLFDVLRVIEKEEVEMKPFWQFAVLNEVDKFMLFILRRTSLMSQSYKSDGQVTTLSNIYEYLTSRYQEDITLDKISKIFYLNKYYIAHAFKKKYGKSLISTLNEIRCNEAEKLLKSTSLSIAQISISVGYNSISYFSSAYKKIKNESPEQTRKALILALNDNLCPPPDNK